MPDHRRDPRRLGGDRLRCGGRPRDGHRLGRGRQPTGDIKIFDAASIDAALGRAPARLRHGGRRRRRPASSAPTRSASTRPATSTSAAATCSGRAATTDTRRSSRRASSRASSRAARPPTRAIRTTSRRSRRTRATTTTGPASPSSRASTCSLVSADLRDIAAQLRGGRLHDGPSPATVYFPPDAPPTTPAIPDGVNPDYEAQEFYGTVRALAPRERARLEARRPEFRCDRRLRRRRERSTTATSRSCARTGLCLSANDTFGLDLRRPLMLRARLAYVVDRVGRPRGNPVKSWSCPAAVWGAKSIPKH